MMRTALRWSNTTPGGLSGRCSWYGGTLGLRDQVSSAIMPSSCPKLLINSSPSFLLLITARLDDEKVVGRPAGVWRQPIGAN